MIAKNMANDLFSLSEFLTYLTSLPNPDSDRLPALNELSRKLGISVASLREQLEVARTLGVVEVRPRTGIRRLPYQFAPAVRQSLAYALAVDPSSFDEFSDLRSHIEASYWKQAVSLLTPDDHAYLKTLIAQAWAKLKGKPVQIPHAEHRELHLCIYRRLCNPFVTGILETYWDAYQAVGLDVYTDYQYLNQVWQYHSEMVEAITQGNLEVGYQLLLSHINMLYKRSQPVNKLIFE
jgi:DNA-binding FadR family transcriptional regulator